MSITGFAGENTGTDKWQRLAPAAIIYFIVKIVGQLLKQGLQGLLPLAVVLFSAGEGRWLIISLIGIAGGAALLLGAFFSYMKFRFRLSADSFMIQSGVFKRKRLTLNYDRIQNVAFKEPIYFRPFGLIVLSIESAGSTGAEVSLGGIPRALAEEIRTTVFSERAKSGMQTRASEAETDDQEGSAGNDEAEEDVIRQPIAELVRYGLSNNQIWVFASIAAGAFAQVDWDDVAVLSALRDAFQAFAGENKFTAAALVFSSFLLGFFALLGVSVAGAIINYYDYHLTRAGGRLHRTNGLFSRHETSLPEQKIQSLVIRQAWPARLLNRFHLQLKQVSFARRDGQQSGEQAGGSTLLVPSVTGEFSRRFASMIYPYFQWTPSDLHQISRLYTRKVILWIILPIATIPTTALVFAFGPWALSVLFIPLLLTPFIMLKRARYGYATDGKHGIIRRGLFGYKLTLFPFHKVQTIKLWQSPGQRKKALASLTIKLAGTSLTVPYMPLADAEAWRDAILFEIESSNKAWM